MIKKRYTKEYIFKLLDAIKLHRLDVFPRFYDYSISYIRDTYNGIGAEWMPESIRNLITKHANVFEPATLEHDVATEHIICEGSRIENPLRFKRVLKLSDLSNKRFCENCCVLARSKYPFYNLKRYYYLFLAKKLWIALDNFGIIGIELEIQRRKKAGIKWEK